MNHRAIALGLSIIVSSGFGVLAAEEATPEEVLAKVREASDFLSEKGEAGLPVFGEAESPFVWKDTYVFVIDCSQDVIAAHPVAANVGRSISDLADVDGKQFGAEMCDAAARPEGGWVEYMWPKAVLGADGTMGEASDASRKLAYVMTVPGQPYQVGAGDYDDTLTITEMEALLAD